MCTALYAGKRLRVASARIATLAGSAAYKVTMEPGIDQQLAAGRYSRAFELIVPEYRDRVFRLAFSILRERAAAEDAAQETFVKIWKALPKFDGRAALGTWIYAITRNTCLMELRRRRPTVSFDDPDSNEARHAAQSIATGPAQDPERDNILKLIEQLPENQQQAVRLFYLEDRSYDAVAAALEMPLGTVKNLLHRARKRLVQLAQPAEARAA